MKFVGSKLGFLFAAVWGSLVSIALVVADDVSESQGFESHSMILMLDKGPVHARFGISMSGSPVARQRANFIRSLVKRLDVNSDGKLTYDEANQSFLLRRKFSKGTLKFMKKRNLNSKQVLSRDEINRMVKRVAGQPVVFRQNDGAQSSDEYIFDLLDEDGSGVVDPAEMATAAQRLFEFDNDDDECIGFDELQPPPENEPDPRLVALGQTDDVPERSHAVASSILRPAADRFLPQRLIRKYDDSGNGKLSEKELRWSAERIATIDTNGDGELSRSELANIQKSPLDIDLSVDVAPPSAANPEFEVHYTRGKKIDQVTRPNMVNLLLQDATVTLSYRHVDPIPEAMDNAMRKFNILDADANGYLEEAEVEGELLFQRELFQRMDSDDDERVFIEEMEAYVMERAEVQAMTCQVNVYDTGSGFFQAMDHNNDGRISKREMRSTEASLASLATDKDPGVSPTEPARRFHIEFSRGGFLLFGSNSQTLSGAVSFSTQVGVGPAWFTGSDRNNDGDLSWNEFLGHREDFHFLDLDQDGLIDPIEAQRAEELRASRN